MGVFLDDPLHDEFALSLGLGLTSHGGCELGEVASTCARISDGDDSSWYEQWCRTGDRLADIGRSSAAAGHRVSAREAFLRACVSYSIAYHPLFGGSRADTRLVDAFHRQRAAFESAAATMEPTPERFDIECDGAVMPAYLFRAAATHRPLLIATNGYDATIYDMYLGLAVPSLRRGYHCLLFDGPGQGSVLFEQGIPIRHDWETVVTSVVDQVVRMPEVDQRRIALSGWSLGGYLALRAASGEERLAAVIADPGLYSISAGAIGRLRAAGVAEDILARFPDIPQHVVDGLRSAIHADRIQQWAVEKRGFWVHGVTDLGAYLRAIAPFTLEGRLRSIRCPALVTMAEADILADSAERVQKELTGHVSLVRFTREEGADMHCEFHNRTLFDQKIFDWLDDVLYQAN